MTNYKPSSNYSISIRGFIIPLPSHVTLIHLYDNVNMLDQIDSLRNTTNNLAYQVPTNHTLHVIAMSISAENAVNVLYYEGATEDAETTLKFTANIGTTITHEQFFTNLTMDFENFF